MVTVSTSAQTRSYHHGDLRSALVEAGLKALETAPIEDLSLRALAREVGVSPTAVYRHFPDKQALLGALAAEGIEQLGQYQQAAATGAEGNSDAFGATGRAYVRWALVNPALFRLVFGQGRDVGSSIFGDNLAARLLQDKALRAVRGDEAEARQLMIQAWAVVHGLAMLMLDGQLPQDDALIDRVIDPRTLFAR
ncbi:MAG: TetR/AcrR family transcriptional regulator [Novosphingobium sp.]|jgi:AcrR family transcriptional regulator|uniref:TetR/AcrR family transcriptional regulator n=1 Tax=Novosphingobium sp. TaxID=1874826 RepID=UPI00391910F9